MLKKNVQLQYEYFDIYTLQSLSFIRIPKLFFTSDEFKELSSDAKILYSILLDRSCLSLKNNLIDENDHVFVYATIKDIQEELNCASEKAIKLLNQLENYNLIKRERQGHGKPNRIYVMNFFEAIIREEREKSASISETEIQGFRKSKFKDFENRNSSVSETEIQELRKSKSNNTYNNKDLSIDTDYSNDITIIQNLWNESRFTKNIKSISSGTERYENIIAALKTFSLEEIKSAINMISESNYLQQHPVSFDWFINREKNIIEKILEGVYSNRTNVTKPNSSIHNFAERTYDYDKLEEALFCGKGKKEKGE